MMNRVVGICIPSASWRTGTKVDLMLEDRNIENRIFR
jgi:hypothetical protein